MVSFITDDLVIKKILRSSKTIAMIGVSSNKKEESSTNIRRRPSIIVMNYLKEFGYKVIPVNPFSKEKEINGETVVSKLEDIATPVDIVNVFRPSAEAVTIIKQSIRIGTKVLWLQYGIENEEAKVIANKANITYIANKCIKQEYQRLFLKVSPVFPVLQNN